MALMHATTHPRPQLFFTILQADGNNNNMPVDGSVTKLETETADANQPCTASGCTRYSKQPLECARTDQ